MADPAARRLVVAITGATGAVYGVRLLQHLRALGGIETHVVVSDSAALTLLQETGMQRKDVEALADVAHRYRDVGASIASGSFKSDGMVIAPCSMKTLASVAHGLSDNLIARAADVVLKERRRLVLLVRETPFNLAHLRNMTAVTEMGGIVFPPLPSFYHRPASIDEMVDHTVARVIDLFGIDNAIAPRWQGMAPQRD
ncbi:MAG TPA: UbiX family flavin prenyltransferase [Telluria sp.]|nr:UbiX family flavin prenyltransferase [Telluria sp.]